MSTTLAHAAGMRAHGRGRSERRSSRAMAPVAWALAVAVALVAVGCLPTMLDRGAGSLRASALATVRVRATDTLWSIAAANRPAGATVAETVDEIRRLNGLGAAPLSAGVSLRVPVPEGGSAICAQTSAVAAVR
jgi:Tfp pilus assembly protein FimV